MRGHPLLLALALAACLHMAGPLSSARADVAFVREGSGVWVAEDDGSRARLLAPLSDFPLAGDLLHLKVRPAGRTLAITATSLVAGRCELWCEGVYLWTTGAGARLSPAPFPSTPLGSVKSFEVAGGIAPDGRVLFDRFTVLTNSTTAVNSVNAYGADGKAASITVTCLDDIDSPIATPNPVDGRIAYVGQCPSEPDFSVIVTDPAGAGPRQIGFDDSAPDSLAWTTDGRALVDYERGADPGIWINDPTTNPSVIRRALVVEGVTGVATTGDGRILFAKDGDIWSIPFSCDGCTFPGSATRLTSGPEADRAPAWTSADLEDADGDGVADRNDRCALVAGPGGCPPAVIRPAGGGAAGTLRDTRAPRLTKLVRTLVRGRLSVTFRLSEPGRVVATVARRRGSAFTTVRTVRVRLRKAGPGRLALGRLAAGSYRITLVARDAAGNKRTVRIGAAVR